MIRMEGGNVAEYRLTSEEFLDGYQAQFGPISLREISDICMVSMAVPLAEEQAVQKALKAAFGIDMPDIGQSQGAAALDSRVLRMDWITCSYFSHERKIPNARSNRLKP